MSKLVESIIEGTVLDRIHAYYQYGELKVRLSDEDRAYEQRLAHTRDLWLEHKRDSVVARLVSDAYNVEDRQAWNILYDAKKLWALQQKFDAILELQIQKHWIESAFEIAQRDSDPKMMKAALEANARWIEMMNREMERNKKTELLAVNITFHMDFREFMTEEEYAQAKAELAELTKKAKRKFKDFEDAEFVEV